MGACRGWVVFQQCWLARNLAALQLDVQCFRKNTIPASVLRGYVVPQAAMGIQPAASGSETLAIVLDEASTGCSACSVRDRASL